MEGDIAPVTEVVKIGERHGGDVTVDEAHATGVQGPVGRGIAVRDGIAQHLVAAVHTCGNRIFDFPDNNGVIPKRLQARARLFAEAQR